MSSEEKLNHPKSSQKENASLLWGAIAIYLCILIIALIHAFKSDYVQCEGITNLNALKECIENSRAAWGQLGDFIGGFVNPIVGLFTIYLLVRTISQQSRALDQTEIALEHANVSLEQNAEVLKLTQHQIEVMQEETQVGRKIQKDTETALNEQISLAREQKNFDNYFTHLKAFEQHIEKLKQDYKFYDVAVYTRQLHNAIYPRMKYGNEELDSMQVKNFINNVCGFLHYLGSIDLNDPHVLTKVSQNMFYADENILSVDFIRIVGHEKPYIDNQGAWTFHPDWSVVEVEYDKLKFIFSCFMFDLNYKHYHLFESARWTIEYFLTFLPVDTKIKRPLLRGGPTTFEEASAFIRLQYKQMSEELGLPLRPFE